MRLRIASTLAVILASCADAGAPPVAPRPVEVPSTKLPNGAFDRGSAANSLGAMDFQRCREPKGPAGGGRFTVLFEPDGSVSKVVVDAGPYPGTPTADCLVQLGLAVRMRPFDGNRVRVGRSFTIK